MRTQAKGTNPMSKLLVSIIALATLAVGCGGSEGATPDPQQVDTATTFVESSTGIRLVSAPEGANIQASPPEGLIILDVRTTEEFAEGHLDGATMIDFYRDDFAEQLEELDPDAPYLLYCRSGNRSGQTTAMMEELGFTNVADIDGGILSWTNAGLPTVTP